MPTLICAACGATFHREKVQGHYSARACSKKCAAAIAHTNAIGSRPLTMLHATCVGCGQHFSRSTRTKGRMRFCSKECADRNRPRGPDNPGWKGGRTRTSTARALVARLKGERGECERCGSTKRLCGHHRLPVSERPDLEADPENIEIICVPCHALEHPDRAGLILKTRMRGGALLKCSWCGEDFYASPSRASKAQFCGHACRLAAMNGPRREDSLARRITIRCEECGGERLIKPHLLQTARFCSNKCKIINLVRTRKQTRRDRRVDKSTSSTMPAT